jgi:hypothetical protein
MHTLSDVGGLGPSRDLLKRLKGIEHSEDLGIYGMILLKRNSGTYDWRMRI